MIAAKLRDKLSIRMVIGSRYTEKSDVEVTWNEIRQQADKQNS